MENIVNDENITFKKKNVKCPNCGHNAYLNKEGRNGVKYYYCFAEKKTIKVGFGNKKRKENTVYASEIKDYLIETRNFAETFVNLKIAKKQIEIQDKTLFFKKDLDSFLKFNFYKKENGQIIKTIFFMKEKRFFLTPIKNIYRDYIIIVEGIFDYWRLQSIGFYNIACSFGCRVTTEMIQELKEQIGDKKIMLFFDNDEAGKEGTELFIQKATENNIFERDKIYVYKYEGEGKDPDEYLYKKILLDRKVYQQICYEIKKSFKN